MAPDFWQYNEIAEILKKHPLEMRGNGMNKKIQNQEFKYLCDTVSLKQEKLVELQQKDYSKRCLGDGSDCYSGGHGFDSSIDHREYKGLCPLPE